MTAVAGWLTEKQPPPARPLEGRGRGLRVAPFALIAAVGVGLALVEPGAGRAVVTAAAGVLVGIVAAQLGLSWRRWRAGWQVLPAWGYFPLAALLGFATRDATAYVFLTALPVIWAVMFHTRRLMTLTLALMGVAVFAPAVLGGGPAPVSWTQVVTAFVLTCLGGLAGHYLLSRSRAAAAEARTAEQRFANVLAAATEQIIFAADTHGVVTVFNVGAERMLGYSADEVIGKHTVELFHPSEELQATATAAGFATFKEMLRHPPPDLPAMTMEWTMVRKDGSRFPALMSVSVMRDGDEVSGYVNVSRDITADREAARATQTALARERAAADRLRELDQVKSDFVATVSHDLRTPLTSIIGNTELLRDGDAGELNAMQRRLLGAVDRNARRLDALVGDLLLLSRIEAGTLRLHPRDVSVNQIVDGALEALMAARAADIALDVDLPAEPVLVRGDPEQLERVTTNLVGNALKFTPPGGRVSISVNVDGEHAVLRISDTGIGIPEAELPHIFDRFFRSSRSQAKKRPGTGLGLTIAKSIVDQHDGTIEASVNPSGGTTFTITLPRLAATADAPEKELA